MDTLTFFAAILQRVPSNYYCDFLEMLSSNIGSTLKRKNLLLEEQILAFESWL